MIEGKNIRNCTVLEPLKRGFNLRIQSGTFKYCIMKLDEF